MGLTVRYYWFDEGNRIHPVSRARFERFWKGKEALTSASSRPVRFAEAIVECIDGQPRRLRSVGGLVVFADIRGFIDEKRQREGLRLAMDSVGDRLIAEPAGKIRPTIPDRTSVRADSVSDREHSRLDLENPRAGKGLDGVSVPAW
jgi:hypothetical protein